MTENQRSESDLERLARWWCVLNRGDWPDDLPQPPGFAERPERLDQRSATAAAWTVLQNIPGVKERALMVWRDQGYGWAPGDPEAKWANA